MKGFRGGIFGVPWNQIFVTLLVVVLSIYICKKLKCFDLNLYDLDSDYERHYTNNISPLKGTKGAV